MDESYIKLYRKFQDWEWYKDSNTKDLFLHLLINANWRDGKYKGYDIPRGSLVTGLQALSEQTGIPIQSIRTSLGKLKKTKEIVQKSTNRFSIITIVKYEDYQRDTREDNKQLTNKQQTTNKQLTTIEEYKNNRYIDIKEKINKKEKYFEEEKLNEIFIEFLKVRKKLKAVNSERAVKILIDKLEKYNDETKYKMIEQSIENSWKGLFELKKDKPYQQEVKEKVPEWFDKEIEIKEPSAEEKAELENILREFSD